MANSVKVFIGGKEYSLTGENPELIRETASIVNKQIENLVSQHGDLPDKSVPFLLAALNIAENEINNGNQIINTANSLTEELKKMELILMDSMNKWYF